MPRLTIHLQHGFADDEVIVTMNGEERLHQASVRSHGSLGLACHEEFEVAEGPLALDVAVPTRGLTHHADLEVTGDLHVGIHIHHDAIRVIASEKRFGYA